MLKKLSKRVRIGALAVFAGCGVIAAAWAVDASDKSFSVGAQAADSFENAISGRVQMAIAALPGAKSEYMSGMREGRTLFLTIRLMDAGMKVEQVYVQVDGWEGMNIRGRIASTIRQVQGYKKGQTVSLSEGDILDWTIMNADGRCEGNFVGGYLENWLFSEK